MKPFYFRPTCTSSDSWSRVWEPTDSSRKWCSGASSHELGGFTFQKVQTWSETWLTIDCLTSGSGSWLDPSPFYNLITFPKTSNNEIQNSKGIPSSFRLLIEIIEIDQTSSAGPETAEITAAAAASITVSWCCIDVFKPLILGSVFLLDIFLFLCLHFRSIVAFRRGRKEMKRWEYGSERERYKVGREISSVILNNISGDFDLDVTGVSRKKFLIRYFMIESQKNHF